MNKISVIIPVYNSDKDIAECLQSVVAQNFEEKFEIILVDDGSTDNSAEICKQYEKEYDFIKFFQNEHKGVSSARNFGLAQANGDYTFFMDSDDTIDKSFFKYAYQSAIENNSDVVLVSMDNYNQSKRNSDKITGLAIWAFFWKTDFLKLHFDIQFNENLKNKEDVLFSFEMLTFTDNISKEPKAVYKYRISEKSAKDNFNDVEYSFDVIKILLSSLSDFYLKYKNTEKLKDHLLRFLADNIFFLIFKTRYKFSDKKRILSLLSTFINENNLPCIKICKSKLSIKLKLFYLLFNVLVYSR